MYQRIDIRSLASMRGGREGAGERDFYHVRNVTGVGTRQHKGQESEMWMEASFQMHTRKRKVIGIGLHEECLVATLWNAITPQDQVRL